MLQLPLGISLISANIVLEIFFSKKKSEYLIYLSAISFATLVFYFDVSVELGVAAGVPYVAVILIGFLARNRSALIQLAVFCTILTLLGWWISPAGGEPWKVMSNRFLALFAIWVTSILCFVQQTKEDQFLESQHGLDTIFNSVPAMIWYKDPHNRILKVNQFGADLMGIPAEEIEGQNMAEFFPDEADDCHLSDLEVIRTGKPKFGLVGEWKTTKGLRWLRTDKVPFREKNGKVVGVILFCEDITDSRESQEQLSLMYTAIEQSHTAVMISDKHGRIEYVNPSFCENTGYLCDEIIGKSTRLLKSGEHSKEFYTDLWKTLKSGEVWRGEFINRTKSGALYPELVTIHPIRNYKGKITHFVWVRIDDVERRQTMRQLQGYARELARSNKDLDEFASIASHDIQEPLRKIVSFGEKLSTGYGPVLDERGNNYLSRMVDAAGRLRNLVRDLIELSRVNRDVRTFALVDLNQVLGEVLVDLEFTVEEKEAVIEKNPLPAIEGNRAQLYQLFQNLVSNALKFHKKHTKPEISISYKPLDDGEVEIEIRDQGIGFDEKYLDKIFKPFERLHTVLDGYTGSGIGLALCRKIALAHGGSISASSQPGKGAVFRVKLPEKQKIMPDPDPEDLL